MKYPYLEPHDTAAKTLLIRADLNVPFHENNITDITRIVRFLPTLHTYAHEHNKVVIMTHLGRPKGFDKKFSTQIIARKLKKLLARDIIFINGVCDDEVAAKIKDLPMGSIIVLENVRFYEEETKNNIDFAKKIARLGDIYMNDAFSCSHRAHASIEAIAHILPAYAGPLLMEEVTALEKALEKPHRPIAAIVGGAKVSTKINLLKSLSNKIDYLIIGGAMANNFLQLQGFSMGKSLVELEYLDVAKDISAWAEEKGCKIILPKDVAVAKSLAKNSAMRYVDCSDIADDEMALDIGPKSISMINDILENCQTLLWNGPLGAFEYEPFDVGTNDIAKHVSSLTKLEKICSIAGGGDTISALHHAGHYDDLSYVSTAGGAFLEWCEGKELPGVKILQI